MKGILYVISAPSGTGKSSLIRKFLSSNVLCNVQVSISYTTREMRPGEEDGKHYFFIDKDKFKEMIKKDCFLEYAKIFNNYYGTSNSIISNSIKNGIDVFLDIDWQGALQIKKKIPNFTRSIFIFPPSKKELLRRLFLRGQDKKTIIEKRMKEFIFEIKHYKEYDYIIINNNFNDAVKDLYSVVRSERLRLNRQVFSNRALIHKLLQSK